MFNRLLETIDTENRDGLLIKLVKETSLESVRILSQQHLFTDRVNNASKIAEKVDLCITSLEDGALRGKANEALGLLLPDYVREVSADISTALLERLAASPHTLAELKSRVTQLFASQAGHTAGAVAKL